MLILEYVIELLLEIYMYLHYTYNSIFQTINTITTVMINLLCFCVSLSCQGLLPYYRTDVKNV